MTHLNTYLQAGIALLVILIVVTLYQMQTRSQWRQKRKIQIENLKKNVHELAQEHPNELRDMLTNARSIQSINAAYMQNPKIRETDRERTQKIQQQTEKQIENLRTAIIKSIEKRAEKGLVTPTHR